MSAPRVSQNRRVFSLECRVEAGIRATSARVWKLLTDAQDFPRWNSTVTRIEGEIRDGATLRVHVPGTTRSFTPTISDLVAERRMTWTGGVAPFFKGVRTFELTPQPDGTTTFVMEERFSGLMLPFASRAMPDFGPVFARYADDLKREAERNAEC